MNKFLTLDQLTDKIAGAYCLIIMTYPKESYYFFENTFTVKYNEDETAIVITQFDGSPFDGSGTIAYEYVITFDMIDSAHINKEGITIIAFNDGTKIGVITSDKAFDFKSPSAWYSQH